MPSEALVKEHSSFMHTMLFMQFFSDLVCKPWENAHIPQDKAPVEPRVLLAATANWVKEKTASAPTRWRIQQDCAVAPWPLFSTLLLQHELVQGLHTSSPRLRSTLGCSGLRK